MRSKVVIFNFLTHTYLGGSPGVVVMGGDSHSEGRGFKSQRQKLDGHDIFHIDLLLNLYYLFEKTKNKQ